MCTFVRLLGENRSMVSIRCAGISRRVGRLKCRWTCLKRRWMCTSYTNLVDFYLVFLQLMLLNCVQLASISTRVNSSMSTKGQHVCVLLHVARDNTAMSGGLYARLCHTFLVKHFCCVAILYILLCLCDHPLNINDTIREKYTPDVIARLF